MILYIASLIVFLRTKIRGRKGGSLRCCVGKRIWHNYLLGFSRARIGHSIHGSLGTVQGVSALKTLATSLIVPSRLTSPPNFHSTTSHNTHKQQFRRVIRGIWEDNSHFDESFAQLPSLSKAFPYPASGPDPTPNAQLSAVPENPRFKCLLLTNRLCR